jgi:hypothetical protein
MFTCSLEMQVLVVTESVSKNCAAGQLHSVIYIGFESLVR